MMSRIYHQPKSLLIQRMVEDAYYYRSDWTDMDLHLEKEWARFAEDGLGYDQVTRWPLDASVIYESESDSDHHDHSCPNSNALKIMIGSLAVGLRVHELGEISQVGKPAQPDLVVALNAADWQYEHGMERVENTAAVDRLAYGLWDKTHLQGEEWNLFKNDFNRTWQHMYNDIKTTRAWTEGRCRSILFHCHGGAHRSTSAAVAFLLMHHRCSLETAVQCILRKRKSLRLWFNREYIDEALVALEHSILSETSEALSQV